MALFGLWIGGCSQPTSRIHGTVKYKGEPLTNGAVVFMVNNLTYPADIKPDGTYEIVGVPRGQVKVVVQVQQPRPPSRPNPTIGKDTGGNSEAAKDDRAKQSRLPPAPPAIGPRIDTAIPPKYGHPDTSGLVLDVKAADHEFNINLDANP